ncbi:TLD family protein [Tritrichomonas foetus]|uniref:TLD family protein n=1 Tax=Tritrichomonas foetus TaxID=1144522 RepID=A0A1J4JBW6_9EUKA|nr:TLD family protein [Tritrichomonas foetus]|eukprot:OHS95147.1 TLD family protein [Tritrichomonas foetus]
MTDINLDSHDLFGFLPEFPFSMTDEWEQEEKIRLDRSKNSQNSSRQMSKNLTRYGLPMNCRRKVWFLTSGGYDLLQEAGDIYEKACQNYENNKEVMKSPIETDFVFGSDLPLNEFLPHSVVDKVTKFLCVLHYHNKSITYAPLIPSTVILLLMFMEPPLAYLAIQAMINRSIEDSWYFAVDYEQFHASMQAIEDLSEGKLHSIWRKAKSLGVNIAHMTLAMLPAFFLPFLPLPVAMTIFDSFIVEGRKILVRFFLTLLKKTSSQLLEAPTSQSFLSILVQSMENLSNVSQLKSFLKSTFGISLQRERHMMKLERACLAHPDRLKKFAGQKSAFRDVIDASKDIIGFNPMSFPRSLDSCRVLTSELIKSTPEELEKEQKKYHREIMSKAIPQIIGGELLTSNILYSFRQWIPYLYRNNSAQCIYSMLNDGTMISTMWDKITKRTAHIIIVKTKRKCFGVFLTIPPSPVLTKCRKEFIGTSGSFVFDASALIVYKKNPPPNNRFFSVSQTMMIIGGPEPALCFEDGFHRIMSDYCETFDSPPLVEDLFAGDSILNLEVYQMVTM